MKIGTTETRASVWRGWAALVGGLLFGAGLAVSQMVNPNKVLGFLDLAGPWDPSLALVMAGALAVTALGYRVLMARRQAPLCDQRFYLPEKRVIDRPLLMGASLFGIGWGMAGYCPGPAVAALVINPREALLMLLGIGLGFVIYQLGQRSR